MIEIGPNALAALKALSLMVVLCFVACGIFRR